MTSKEVYGLERSHGDREDCGSNLGLAKLTFEENFSLHQAKMIQTLKSTWVTGVGKIPVEEEDDFKGYAIYSILKLSLS